MQIPWPWYDTLDAADKVLFFRLWITFYMVLAPLEWLMIGFQGLNGVLCMVIVNPLAAAAFGRVAMAVLHLLAHSTIHGLAGSGGDPYRLTHSQEEAMVIRGDWQGAITSYREHLVVHPENLIAKIRLARLILRNSETPEAAEHLYLEIRQADSSGTHDLEVANSLIDYYRATKQEEKLRVELSRMSRLHAGTVHGDGARRALREMTESRG